MANVLDKINGSADVKKISPASLENLCAEIRSFLLDTVSKTGGHLSSNLGVVELTVALYRVLNLPADKLIWDVGHQSYVHKILSGRKDQMPLIRSLNGLCGFTDPEESEFDVSIAGHSSTSLSTAAGMAAARDLRGDDHTIAAVIGDGALTGGLAFEALNHIGQAKQKMLIVLNDNEMSIHPNVGGLSEYLTRARTSPRYTKSKQDVEEVLERIPRVGQRLSDSLRHFKNNIKYIVSAGVWFEEMGITYLGPIDGHDIEAMERTFRRALMLDEPVMVHVVTQKGKGYRFAEREPHRFHSISGFERKSGAIKNGKRAFSDVFGETLCALAEENPSVVAITPSMMSGSGLSGFARKFPRRFFDVGIAEQHAVTFAAGLAAGGLTPVAAIYSTFLQRAYDNLIEDAAIANLHVVFALDRAGFVDGDGATHQGLFDLSYLTQIPNMAVLAPSSFSELEKMLRYAALDHNGPIALRYPKGPEIRETARGPFILGKAEILREGADLTIAAEGSMVARAQNAADRLEAGGISAEVIDMRTIKPLDADTVFESAKKTGFLLTLEANVETGGMGQQLAFALNARGFQGKLFVKAAPDSFATHATQDEIMRLWGLDAESLCGFIKKELKN